MRSDAHAMIALAGTSLIIWVLLKFFRGGFWRADQYLCQSGSLREWPTVVVIIPARNEEQTIGDAVKSLAKQDYPGLIHIVVVDDESSDSTLSLVGNWPNLHVVQGVAAPIRLVPHSALSLDTRVSVFVSVCILWRYRLQC